MPRRPHPRWLEIEAQRAAARAAVPPEDWARLDGLLRDAIWRDAVTYASTNPHCYSVRRTWTRDEDFVWTVELIRRVGERERFPDGPGGRFYDILRRGDRKIWVMGWPINWPNGKPCTTILNRKPVVQPGDRTS